MVLKSLTNMIGTRLVLLKVTFFALLWVHASFDMVDVLLNHPEFFSKSSRCRLETDLYTDSLSSRLASLRYLNRCYLFTGAHNLESPSHTKTGSQRFHVSFYFSKNLIPCCQGSWSDYRSSL